MIASQEGHGYFLEKKLQVIQEFLGRRRPNFFRYGKCRIDNEASIFFFHFFEGILFQGKVCTSRYLETTRGHA
jgi:hypothetical protein